MSETGEGFAMGGWFEHTQENCAKKKAADFSAASISQDYFF